MGKEECGETHSEHIRPVFILCKVCGKKLHNSSEVTEHLGRHFPDDDFNDDFRSKYTNAPLATFERRIIALFRKFETDSDGIRLKS